MALFDRFFRRNGGKQEEARRAELRGDLQRAAELWGMAEQPEEAARVMLLRGDGEADPARRLVHYTQAVALAPSTLARSKRAQLVVSLASTGVLSAALRRDVLAAGAELEELGELLAAAEAFRLAGDRDGEARVLTGAGEVERLEQLLADDQVSDRGARRVKQAHDELELLVQCGRRREALARARALARELPGEEALARRGDGLQAGRVCGPLARVLLDERALTLVLGSEVIIGRTEGALRVASHAVSRRHVRLARGADGAARVGDAGSRNGTKLRGLSLAGEVLIGNGLELRLGGEVPLLLRPSDAVQGGVEVQVAGETYHAPLGAARLPVDGWSLEQGDDGWVELVTAGGATAFLRDVSLVARATLLAGDELASCRGAAPRLKLLG